MRKGLSKQNGQALEFNQLLYKSVSGNYNEVNKLRTDTGILYISSSASLTREFFMICQQEL